MCRRAELYHQKGPTRATQGQDWPFSRRLPVGFRDVCGLSDGCDITLATGEMDERDVWVARRYRRRALPLGDVAPLRALEALPAHLVGERLVYSERPGEAVA